MMQNHLKLYNIILDVVKSMSAVTSLHYVTVDLAGAALFSDSVGRAKSCIL